MISNLREMAHADLQMVLQWRNRAEVRGSSFNSEVISFEEHLAWWERESKNPLADLLVFEWRGVPVGVVIFTYDSDAMNVAQWSFYIGNPIEAGIGTRMGMAAIEYAFFIKQAREINGRVISFNEKSTSFHQRLGFEKINVEVSAYSRAENTYNVLTFSLKSAFLNGCIQNKMKDGEVVIRPLTLNDIDDEYISWYQNTDGHLNYFTGSRRSFTKKDILTDFFEGMNSQEWFYYLIESEGGSKIGNVKVGPIDKVNMSSDLVCLMGNREFAGKGLAAKSIEIVNQLAFENHNIRRLQGGMYEDHIASIRAYSKAGWIEEARMKGFYWVNGKAVDRVCVACLNPKYFEND